MPINEKPPGREDFNTPKIHPNINPYDKGDKSPWNFRKRSMFQYCFTEAGLLGLTQASAAALFKMVNSPGSFESEVMVGVLLYLTVRAYSFLRNRAKKK